MRISFRSKGRRFTLTTGEDDIEEILEEPEALEFIEVTGSYELAPTEADYEDATYVIPDEDEGRSRRSFGFTVRP